MYPVKKQGFNWVYFFGEMRLSSCQLCNFGDIVSGSVSRNKTFKIECFWGIDCLMMSVKGTARATPIMIELYVNEKEFTCMISDEN